MEALSTAPAALLRTFRTSILPSLAWSAATLHRHKGECGRIGIVGGCSQYHGAPFYAAMAALRGGGDLASVFCAPSAALAIKSLSPELMVAPLLPESTALAESSSALAHSQRELRAALPRIRSLAIGPGLGRDPLTLDAVASLVLDASTLPIVLDGDALHLVATRVELLTAARGARAPIVLTPNAAEFQRLFKAVCGSDAEQVDWSALNAACTDLLLAASSAASSASVHLSPDAPIAQPAVQLARALGVIVVHKGPVDIVTDGHTVLYCATGGSPRRCGGQGDLLAGLSSLFLSYGHAAGADAAVAASEPSAPLVALWCACAVVRGAARTAFERHLRATTTPDILAALPDVMERLFPTERV